MIWPEGGGGPPPIHQTSRRYEANCREFGVILPPDEQYNIPYCYQSRQEGIQESSALKLAR